jgi:hypothetical protein
MMRPFTLRQIVTLLAATGVAALVGGCGRTLLFAESDGINLAIKTNPSSSTPVEVNFGLTRTVGTIVPPAGGNKEAVGGKPEGEAVNMFSGFEINNAVGPTKTIDPAKPIDVDLTVDTQFASGPAAKAVADKPRVVAQIVNVSAIRLTVATSDSAKRYRVWLMPDGNVSDNRFAKLQDWLDRRYPPPNRRVFPGDLLGDTDGEDYEAARVAALTDLKDVPPK